MSLKDTICAVATPPGQGGIGIVRVSGPKAGEVLGKIWAGKCKVPSFESHRMYFGSVKDPVTVEKIDSVLSVWMKKPNSYTGEDVVEISCHGGPSILERILGACRGAGARSAGPGEFTKRAYLNGKMDLLQAEAVADLISATSEKAARMASRQLEGRLSKEINIFLEELTKIRAFVEASIDFPEEDIEFIEKEGIAKKLEDIVSRMRALAETYNEGRIIRDGVRVAIVGKPNVGKSSLFNALVGRDRAIVHHTSGTTRDLVTETEVMGGIVFHLTDAAGFRESDHAVEKIGIEKARDAMGDADIILLVMDGSVPPDDEDRKISKSLDRERTIVCLNKSDLPRRCGCETQGARCEISVSALKGNGVESLRQALVKRVADQKSLKSEGVVITTARHKEALSQAVNETEAALKVAKEGVSAEFIAHHLRQANEFIGQITGTISTDAILEQIFSRFCIGK